MIKYTAIHQILGISDEREEEIATEVVTTLVEAGRVDVGTKKLMETYPPEALLAGMRLIQAINLNKALMAEQQASVGIWHRTGKQNAALN